tara:strand:+ start:133 stop:618 length:486 start_codon:yes stop_codon:yes gene_type:complete
MKKESPIQLATKQFKLGRPKINLKASPYKETIEEVLFWISSGQTLRAYCRQKNKPCYATIYSWMNIPDCNESEEFSKRFVHARERGAEMIGESILESLNEPPRMIGEDDQRIDPAWVQLKRVKADVTLRLLSKWSSRYSDKVIGIDKANINLTISTGLPQA